MRNNNISQEAEVGVSAELCLTVLAEIGISLDEDDRIELITSLISIRGMSEAQVKAIIIAKAMQIQLQVEGNDEELMLMLKAKLVAADLDIPSDMEAKLLASMKLSMAAKMSASMRAKIMLELIMALKLKIAAGGGLVMSAGMVAEFIANISHKSNVTLTAAQSLQITEAVKITAAQSGMTEAKLEAWLMSSLMIFSATGRLELKVSSLGGAAMWEGLISSMSSVKISGSTMMSSNMGGGVGGGISMGGGMSSGMATAMASAQGGGGGGMTMSMSTKRKG